MESAKPVCSLNDVIVCGQFLSTHFLRTAPPAAGDARVLFDRPARTVFFLCVCVTFGESIGHESVVCVLDYWIPGAYASTGRRLYRESLHWIVCDSLLPDCVLG